MDDFFTRLRHIGYLPRRFSSSLRVDSIGYVPHKTQWIRHRFNSFNFSFILSGGGEYWRKGACWPVRAPCVITQCPGVFLEYGPAGAWKEWEELYIIYTKGRIPALEQMGLIQRDTPAWYIRDSAPMRVRISELKRVAENIGKSGYADCIDRLCELMVIESIVGETRESAAPEARTIQEIRDHVHERFLERHDFHALARKHGLSPSTFRRHWHTHVEMPPGRYAMQLRIREACRLLVESRLRIGEIAESLRFSDPLYFSRRFRLETGVTAAEYRRRHHSPLSLPATTSNAQLERSRGQKV